MSFLIAILILLLVWFFMIAPFLRLYRAVTDAQKQAREFQRRQQQSQRQQQWQRQQQHDPKKKIDPTVGEYVQFTEVTATETHTDPADGSTTSTTTRESQVTDVTWEDL